MKMDPPAHPSLLEKDHYLCPKCRSRGFVVCQYDTHDVTNTLPCGCEAYDIFAPLTDDRSKDYGLTFKSRCDAHAAKVDSRKADASIAYAFTLTMPPDYEPKKPIEEVARLICENGMTSKPYERPSQWAYVIEHTEAGTPHIHGMYKIASGRRIEQKYFKRYWPLWDEKVKLGHGHKGGYHQKARHEECYDAYIQKEGVVHRNKEKSPSCSISPELISHT